MLSCAALLSSATSILATISSSPAAISFPTITTVTTRSIIRLDNRAFIKQSFPSSSVTDPTNKSSLHYDSLRLLEWGKLCDSVASFASTSLGRDATKAQLWSLNQTYEESMRLLDETNAAVEMQKHGGCSLNFSSVDVVLVKSAIQQARRGLPMDGIEAMAVVDLLLLAETMQSNLKAAIKEDSDWYKRFMPLTEVITELVVNRSVIKLIQKLIDEDGSVKDSASPNLKRSRDQVRMLERKLYQYMDSLIRNEMNETSSTEVTSIDGRWCIRSADELTSFQGLLLSSGSGVGTIVEPLSAVPLNDELQQARASVAKAETDVLLLLTEKMQLDLDDIEKLLNSVTRLDVINARATYSLSFGGTCPDLFLLKDESGSLTTEAHLSRIKTPKASHPAKRKWTLYLPKSYHPLLLQQHRQNLQKARKDVSQAKFEIRRKLQEGNMTRKGESDTDISTLQMQVTKLEQAHPVPVDFFISRKTRVLVITGPNTGGKTICLKTVGLAAMMAKSGLYVLSSESVQIPWFDSVFADIGDEQSLSQSLSTFSGHLKQLSEIQSQSTSQSLVLLDEVGAGTNPLEGAALGMSVLEFFAATGASLTLATTHHGELKTLKYSNDAFENACMEFDEVNLKPTYKILWGVPGRSNAINIAERIGLPNVVVDDARELHGATSAELNEVIIDMERFKQDIQKHIYEAQHHLTLSRELREKLLVARREIMEHGSDQRYKKIGQISEAATIARSTLHKKVRQLRQSSSKATTAAIKTEQYTADVNSKHSTATKSVSPVQSVKPSLSGITNYISEEKGGLLKVGDMVHISSIGKKGTILRVEPSKQEILVQAGNMKLKLKFSDVRKA